MDQKSRPKFYGALVFFCISILSCSMKPPSPQVTESGTKVEKDREKSFALFGEEAADPAPAHSEGADSVEKPLTMAILYFENIVEDESLDRLRTFLPDAFMPKLSQSQIFQIVEREELNRVMDELSLNQSAAIDPKTAQRIGKLLGAQTLFSGGFFPFGTRLHLNGHLYRVETAEVITSIGGDSVREDGKALRQLTENLSLEMLATIERKELTLRADIWYERGRNAEQDGDPEKAKQMYQTALKLDTCHRETREKLGLPPPHWKKERIVVAVLPFTIESGNDEFDRLAFGLIDLFTTALSRSLQIRIVERQRLKKIMEELNLDQRSIIDPDTQQQLRKILGATLLCYGSLVDFWGEIQLTVKLTRTETGALIARSEYSDSDKLPEKLTQMAESVAKEIRDYVKKNHRRLVAGNYYERGRNVEADGDYEKAEQMYKRALEVNKKHRGAKDALERLSQ